MQTDQGISKQAVAKVALNNLVREKKLNERNKKNKKTIKPGAPVLASRMLTSRQSYFASAHLFPNSLTATNESGVTDH